MHPPDALPEFADTKNSCTEEVCSWKHYLRVYKKQSILKYITLLHRGQFEFERQSGKENSCILKCFKLLSNFSCSLYSCHTKYKQILS